MPQKWINPLGNNVPLIPITQDTTVTNGVGLPIFPHLGSFSAKRKNHTHEGVDLYCADGSPVYSATEGVVVGIVDFTGVAANSPWWEDTQAVLVKADVGVIVYGEIVPNKSITVGKFLAPGDHVGNVKRVLKVDKGRPMSMLHLELHKHHPSNTIGHHPLVDWGVNQPQPENLLDPTPFLLDIT